ncbi:MAG: hypothetical protein AUJ08_04710 [Thaumarchaeota archaeon 13_1_40CM_3_50_5]|nr:MAG: hypothetical protein AUJ08_04710 [Thaumarchaeota archaeon 13_1_40CM_3_50_5]
MDEGKDFKVKELPNHAGQIVSTSERTMIVLKFDVYNKSSSNTSGGAKLTGLEGNVQKGKEIKSELMLIDIQDGNASISSTAEFRTIISGISRITGIETSALQDKLKDNTQGSD